MPAQRKQDCTIKHSSVLFAALLFVVAATSCFAKQTVESVAIEVARQHNANANSMLDEITVSTSAKAEGRNVLLSYVLKVKRDLPVSTLQEFKAQTMAEIVPRVCQMNAQNEAFKKGLYYTFVYHNTYGDKLMEFVVNRANCEMK